MVKRLCIDHPHQTLNHLYALKNAYGNVSNISHEAIARAELASTMLRKVAKSSERHESIVQETEALLDAYNELAYTDLKRKSKQSTKNSLSAFRLAGIRDLNNACVPTKELPVDPTCRYENIVSVREFRQYYLLVGGINLPRKVECVGSDGVVYHQLVKGNDDLRQDAILQQIFSTVDRLFQRHLESRRRKLAIRTYKVIPLSSRSGLLEWVNATLPIASWLSQAHQRYYPNDLTATKCREVMQGEDDRKGWSAQSKLKVFERIQTKFHPVMRHFFFESFPDPNVWLDRRTAYTRSVATNSMLGFLLGLGDRHASNILIDKITAELIHIDLGLPYCYHYSDLCW